MAKPVFVPFETVIPSTVMNQIATTVWDALGEATTPAEAITAIGAVEETDQGATPVVRVAGQWIPLSPTEIGAHNNLLGRFEEDAHPIEAITGLSTTITGINDSIGALGNHAGLVNRDAADSHPIAAITGLQSALSAIEGDISSLQALRVSVTEFGAVGDGVTDDTAAIQAAIDAAGNGSVFFPNGVYLISDTLEITRNSVCLVGSGRTSAAIRISGDITGVYFHPPASSDNVAKSNCGMLNIHVNHVNGNTTSPAIVVSNQSGFTFLNVSVGNHQRCLRLEGISQSNFSMFNFSASGNTAAAVAGGGAIEVDTFYSTVSDEYIPAWTSTFSNFIIGGAGLTEYSIKIISCDGLLFSNAYIAQPTDAHIYINDGPNAAVVVASFNNIYCDGVNGITSNGVQVASGSDQATLVSFNNVHVGGVTYGYLLNSEAVAMKITNCTMSNITRVGILADGTSYRNTELVVANLIMVNVGTDATVNNAAIYLKNIRHATLSGNILSAAGTNATGLLLEGEINQLSVTGCHYKNCTTDYRQIVGTTVSSYSAAGNNSTKDKGVGVGVTTAGTWTPSLVAGTNITTGTTYLCNYSRNGDIVHVGGQISVTQTAAGAFDFTLSLPIASNFGASTQASGTAIGAAGDPDERASIIADTTADALKFAGTAIGSDAFTLMFTAIYRIL